MVFPILAKQELLDENQCMDDNTKNHKKKKKLQMRAKPS